MLKERDKVLKTPRTRLDKVGNPRRLPLQAMSEIQRESLRYDWTPWDKTQIRIMEAQWDEWAVFYGNLLPVDCRYGINLGTHNGTIQKALERTGYQMYGVEYTAQIAQLHEYGCKGERGNFFNMPHIKSERFDFAIVDRALCSNIRTSWDETPEGAVEKGQIEIPLDYTGDKTRFGPPFFNEVTRIVRPAGIIIVSFRTYVSRLWIDDLATRGTLTIYIDDRKRPYYICVLKKTDTGTEIKSLPDFITMLSSKKNQRAVYESDYCVRISETRKEISFLYVPDNRKITIALPNWSVVSTVPYFESV